MPTLSHDQEYVKKRNQLIPHAEAVANEQCGKHAGAEFDYDRLEWAREWNKAFAAEMTKMVKAAGLFGNHRRTVERDFLIGKDEIERFTGHGWNTIYKWIERKGFPAKIMAHKWESSRTLINRWFQEQIVAK